MNNKNDLSWIPKYILLRVNEIEARENEIEARVNEVEARVNER